MGAGVRGLGSRSRIYGLGCGVQEIGNRFRI
jgi:hypothetical protein